MECKLSLAVFLISLAVELIDTLWNVNNFLRKKQSGVYIELIDTLWNVNFADGSVHGHSPL